MNKLEESLLVLKKFAVEIAFRTILLQDDELFNVLNKYEHGYKETLFTTLMGMNIVDACSYIDEYNNCFGHKENFKGFKITISGNSMERNVWNER